MSWSRTTTKDRLEAWAPSRNLPHPPHKTADTTRAHACEYKPSACVGVPVNWSHDLSILPQAPWHPNPASAPRMPPGRSLSRLPPDGGLLLSHGTPHAAAWRQAAGGRAAWGRAAWRWAA
eukprot:355993-Chlamydomonas_euryale.AAC.5